MITKERKTLTLDTDVLAELDDDNLSAEVNQILRDEIARRHAHDALAAFLAGLEAEFGPSDPALVEEFSQALR